MHDTDKDPSPAQQPNAPVPMVTTQMGYTHPQGFEPVAFFIAGMDRSGNLFINMPIDQPHLCLHLATKGLDAAAEIAVKHMQGQLTAQSPIVKVPPGLSIPPWMGPAGRG